jgi:hypothetical protein
MEPFSRAPQTPWSCCLSHARSSSAAMHPLFWPPTQTTSLQVNTIPTAAPPGSFTRCSLPVHCKGGKGRTGTMICALMMTSMHISSSEAIEYYGNKRSVDVSRSFETVRSPSQQMMLEIFQQSLGMSFIPSVSRVLNGIIISSSIIGIDCLNPVVAVYQQNSLVHCSVPKKGRNTDVGIAPAEWWRWCFMSSSV